MHLVFQVLNYLSYSDHAPLSDDEKLLLIFLAKHSGEKGIYPSVSNLAKQLKKHPDSIRRTLKKLKNKNLISIKLRPGTSSVYALTCLSTPCVDAGGLDSGVSASMQGGSLHPRIGTPCTHAGQSNNLNNDLNKREGRGKKPAPLSDDFLPNQKSLDALKEAARRSGKAEDDLIRKFKNVQCTKEKESHDWQAEFQNFMINERAAPAHEQNQSGFQHSRYPDWTGKANQRFEEMTRRDTEYRQKTEKEFGNGKLPSSH